MNQQERLFDAIGGADPYLVARSEKRRRHWAGYCLAAAACLALVLTAGRFLHRPAIGPTVNCDNSMHEDLFPDGRGEFLLPGSSSGTLRLLSYAPLSQEEAVNFLIYVNEEQFSISEENGRYRVRNTDPLPEDFPECGLDILHLSGTSPAEAAEAAAEALGDCYTEVFSGEENAGLLGRLYVRAGNGTDWDSEQAELWFEEDGRGGTFVLISRYFLEAEEGLGVCFRDMASSFRVVPSDETAPGWMRELYETTDRLFPALFSNDLSGVSDLLAEDCGAEAYGEDVWADVTVASVDYALDSDQDPSEATVSVKHRLNQVEGDGYSYLTMNLTRRNESWYLNWSGIEK